MKTLNHVQQRLTSFTQKQIKYMGHTINAYSNKDVMFNGIKRFPI